MASARRSLTKLKAEHDKIYHEETSILDGLYQKEKLLFIQKKLIEYFIPCIEQYLQEESEFNFDKLVELCDFEFRKKSDDDFCELLNDLQSVYVEHLKETNSKFDRQTNREIESTSEMKADMVEAYKHFLVNTFDDFVAPLKAARRLEQIKAFQTKLVAGQKVILSKLTKVQTKKATHIDLLNKKTAFYEKALQRIKEEIAAAGGLPTLCFEGHLAELKDYLAYFGDETVNEMNGRGEMPLHRACEGGHLDVVEFLMDKKANPIILDDRNSNISGDRFDAFHYACGPGKNQLAILTYLYQREKKEGDGLALARLSEHKKTLLHFATLHDRKSIVKWLLGPEAKFDYCCALSIFGVYRDKIDINAQDKTGSTCLHFAARYGFAKIAAILLNNNANAVLKDKQGFTAMQIALRHQRKQVLVEFINKGHRLKMIECTAALSTLSIEAQDEMLDFYDKCMSEYVSQQRLVSKPA